ncbi:MAG: uracil-DNA glycosylase [Peptoniphilaceae bacterium]|nr:uracil-DNA glycosylase [Peptoniphilaceae bacterium]MDD7383468.1 uracil-DNA glycosylase [Peptoniphilaceae bacterium]MDY3738470.1 uracil-DNA glycosylase [Peptoniphilaceae bacterium]
MTVNIGNDWDELLKDEWTKPYYQNLRKTLINEYKNYKVYPNMYDIFNALKETSFKNTKVVILGQDPYHEEGQAHGMAFSVKKNIPIPPSLKNIYIELKNDLGLYIPNNGYLLKWAKQGVLLLNTTLTVRAHKANSHANIGWVNLTDKIISLLSNRDKSVVFLLWGSNAQSKINLIDANNNLILKAPHPSPLSAYRGFFGCKHFSKTNNFLKQIGEKPIDFQIENI